MSGSDGTLVLPQQLTPDWIAKHYAPLKKQLSRRGLTLDCASLQSLDSLGRAFLSDLHRFAEVKKNKLVLHAFPESLKQDLQKIPKIDPEQAKIRREKPGPAVILGDGTIKLLLGLREFSHLLAESLYWSTWGFFRKKSILPGSSPLQMIRLGSSALPIVLLLSFLIGLTLAIQSAIQLEKFGASIYLASGIGISMVTEIGPMMTAIIIAGRSGSSITAEISTMVVQEELRALKTMGINPIHFLLLPRFWALSLMLPALTLCSDIMGISAGLLVSYFYLDVPVSLFMNELQWGVDATMVIQSMIKTLTFAWIITLVAVYKGFNTRGGADAVGKSTTSCVVTCLFSIILADAIFSFLFYF